MTIAYYRFLSVLVICCILLSVNSYADEEEFLGDVSDGNRSIPVHLIEMFDADSGRIRPDDQPIMPFSTKQTCLPCHNYEKISLGLHFNTMDSVTAQGRPGEPWILVDYLTATQIPLSHHNWLGLFHPDDIGFCSFNFVQTFGRHMPGGGVGENGDADLPELIMRWLISGELEINCLSCHEGDPAHDQAEYAAQVMRQNFRWAATASSGFGHVYGSAKNMPDNYDIYSGRIGDEPGEIPPMVEYAEGTFNSKGKVFFNITRKVPNERCYFCHSTKYIGGGKSERWEFEDDVHLKAGLMCVDCHRHGLDHNMIRGYEEEAEEMGNPAVVSFSCKGCHIPDASTPAPETGRLGAPEPKHAGIPVIHFDKLSCTACHSGPWPLNDTYSVKTSRAHALGVQGAPKSDQAMPHIVGPVFVRQENGKLAPHKSIYPSFWAFIEGDSLLPIPQEITSPIAQEVISQDTLTDSTNFARLRSGIWPNFTKQQVIAILEKLDLRDSTKSAGFINAGKLYRLNESAGLTAKDHLAAQPYSWAFAHQVRPASQSLGIRGCQDCHSPKSAFHFGKISLHSPIVSEPTATKSMLSFQKLGVVYPRLFAFTFFFRPWLKIAIMVCCFVIFVVLLKYSFRGIDRIFKIISEKDW